MEMKYYNASNNFSAPIRREPKPYRPYADRMEVIVPQTPVPEKTETLEKPKTGHKFKEEKSDSLFNNFQTDDWLLIGLILVLILDSNDDILLLLILGYLLLTGWNKNEG